MLFFYFITPTLLSKKLNRRIVISLGYLVIFGILYGGGYCDIRLIFNFLCYTIGLCLSKSKYWWNDLGEHILSNRIVDLSIIILYPSVLMFGGSLLLNPLMKALISLFGVAFVLAISFLIGGLKNKTVSKVFSNISYTSMALYLFHRLFYFIGLSVFEPELPLFKALYMLLILFPIGYILSYFVQKTYDSICNKF